METPVNQIDTSKVEVLQKKITPEAIKAMNLFQRLGSPSPKFFKNLQNIGLILGAISGAVMIAPVALPAALVTFAGYCFVGSAVLATVSKLPVQSNAPSEVIPADQTK
jgi:hypothetical protein